MNFSPNEVLGMVKGVKGAEISNQLPEFIRRMNIPENGTENPTDTKKGNDFISNLISGLGGKKGTEKDPNSKGSDNTSTSDQSKMSTDRQKQLLMAGNTLASFIDNAANASVIKSNKADLHPDQKFTDPMEAKLLDYSAQRAEADRQIRGFNQGLDQNVSSSVQGNRMKLGALAQNINAKNQINQNEENANQQIKSQVNQMNNQIQQANNQIDQQNRLNRWTQRREVAAQEGQNKAQIGQDLITANTNQQKLMENERVNALTDKFYNDQLTTNKEQQKVGLLTSHPDTVKTIFAMYDKDKMMSQFNMTDAEYESIKMQLNDPNKYKKWKEAQEQTTQLTATINGKGNVSVTNEQTGNTNTGGNVKVNRFGGILNKYGNRK
jgi:hypothetical protein